MPFKNVFKLVAERKSKNRFDTYNMELNDLRIIICLRKSEITVVTADNPTLRIAYRFISNL